MRKLKLLLGLLAGAFMLVAPTASVAAADTGPTTGAVVRPAACSTWQYNTDPNMPIYAGPGSGFSVRGYTASVGIVNVTQFSGDWRYGNFYWIDSNGGAHWYEVGWIHISHVHYIRCW